MCFIIQQHNLFYFYCLYICGLVCSRIRELYMLVYVCGGTAEICVQEADVFTGDVWHAQQCLKRTHTALTVIGACVKSVLAEVPRALCYSTSPPSSQQTGIQAAALTTLRLAYSDRREYKKIDYTPRHAGFPHAAAPFIPPFMCVCMRLLPMFDL